MRRLLFLLMAGSVAVLAGCDTAEPEQPGQLVVEAFLHANEPLDTLSLRQTLSLGGSTLEEAARGADVRLTLADTVVRYRERPGQPGRYLPASPVVARAGAPFALAVEWNGQTARAEGHIPPPIRLDTVVVRVPEAPVRTVLLDSLRRDSLDVPAEQGYIFPIGVDLVWTAPPGRHDTPDASWIHARLHPFNPFSSRVIDFFLEPEAVFRETTAPTENGRRRWSGVYAVPADGADAPLPPHRLRVGLIRSDSAYARFARTQGIPDRRAPDGNVRGALGVASGVAVDRRTLRVGE